ncbi:MAG TPA: gamma-glutamyl-gamma-aminobutyrate hydrolase family protein [Gemmatimonadaceae bacterium]|nr:gamma-glutamyl-gamma-aminobutyrate hydrolase family protein [Gemmatimonadaceae bacterium]
MRHLVAISATCGPFHGAERVRLSANYVRSIEGAGLVPIVVPPLAAPARAEEILAGAGGLLLTGGEDVDPARYGAAPHPALGAVHTARDATEVALLAAARERRLPVLAICRGIQLLNVALGGTLVQDLSSERPSAIRHDQPHDREARTHDVAIAADSTLAAATGATAIAVNSYHHQAVDRLGHGLRVTATALDGVIEGAEVEDRAWWVVAVQWHPEDLTTDVKAWDRGIFKAFAEAVGERR